MIASNNNKKSYYEILNVSWDADPETLKKAYRRLVKKYHPDKQPESDQAEERFKELQEAYEVLKDPKKRSRYDTAYSRQRARSGGRRPGKKKPGMPEIVEDVFDFLKNRMENRGKRGEDLRYLLTLPFEEAACGVKKVIHIPKSKDCPACDGRGWNAPDNSPVCRVCRGEGEITVAQGKTRKQVECPGCDGKGLHEKKACKRCKGEGSVVYRVKRSVTIPGGVDNGTRLKIRGEGGTGEQGGEKGDLYIVIQVKDHPVFSRHNLDVWAEIPIHFTQAVLGDEVKVPSLEGERVLTIPPGTQTGEVFTLKGLGIPGLNGSFRGDQKVKVHVQVPRTVTREEKKILKAWEEIQKKAMKRGTGAE